MDEDKTGSADLSEIEESDIPVTQHSLIDKLKSAFGKKTPSEKPGGKNKIIQIVLVLVLIYLGMDTFFNSEDEDIAQAPVITPKYKRKKNQPPPQVSTPEDSSIAASPAESQVPDPESFKSEDLTSSSGPSDAVSEPVDLGLKEPSLPDLEPLPTESEPALNQPESSEVTESESQAPSDNTIPTETQSGQTQGPVGEATTESAPDMTDQILKDLEDQVSTQKKPEKKEYVAPPDYEYLGRGLVYNCIGKHWACVDAPSYKLCEENASSSKYLGKKTECHPFNVYETQKGCEKVQNEQVSSSAKTDFCY
jgi:hypothetical protein